MNTQLPRASPPRGATDPYRRMTAQSEDGRKLLQATRLEKVTELSLRYTCLPLGVAGTHKCVTAQGGDAAFVSCKTPQKLMESSITVPLNLFVPQTGEEDKPVPVILRVLEIELFELISLISVSLSGRLELPIGTFFSAYNLTSLRLLVFNTGTQNGVKRHPVALYRSHSRSRLPRCLLKRT